MLRPPELRRIGREGGPPGQYLAAKGRLWMNLWRACFAVEGAAIFDCFAILAATHPHLLETEYRYASITPPPPTANSPINPRSIHLLAASEPGNPPAREVQFCRRPLPGARKAIVQRLIARIEYGHSQE